MVKTMPMFNCGWWYQENDTLTVRVTCVQFKSPNIILSPKLVERHSKIMMGYKFTRTLTNIPVDVGVTQYVQ